MSEILGAWINVCVIFFVPSRTLRFCASPPIQRSATCSSLQLRRALYLEIEKRRVYEVGGTLEWRKTQ